MVKAGLKEPPNDAIKKAVGFVGDFDPPDNDDLAVERHLKALEKEEKSKNRRPGVISTLTMETQLYREAEIRSLEAPSRVKKSFEKYSGLLNPTEVSSNNYSVVFTRDKTQFLHMYLPLH